MTDRRREELTRAYIDAPIIAGETKVYDLWMMAAQYADEHPAKEEPSILDDDILEYMNTHQEFFGSKAVFTRARNVLWTWQIKTFRDIINYGKRRLANSRNCGKLSIEGYEKMLASVGLSFETQI